MVLLAFTVLMRAMEADKDAPNLAPAVNIGAFNLNNAISAALGGAVINLGAGLFGNLLGESCDGDDWAAYGAGFCLTFQMCCG